MAMANEMFELILCCSIIYFREHGNYGIGSELSDILQHSNAL